MKEQRIYITIDLGTTAVKVSAVNEYFELMHSKGEEYLLITDGNRVELQAETYWEVTKKAMKELLSQISVEHIVGITITSQGETLIPVDVAGKPLYHAVVWLDGRAEKQANKIKEKISDEEFFEKTGIPECNGLCPVSKLLWFLEEEPDIYEQIKYFLLLEDYIIFCLTGRFATEKSLLSTTGYFNLEKDTVWNEILDHIGVDVSKIPPLYECGEQIGTLLPSVAEEFTVSSNISVVTGAMDQVCGAIGAGNVIEGIVTETTGTALCIGATTAKIPTIGKIATYRHYKKELFLLLPVCMTAGMSLKWFKDHFCKEEMKEAEKRNCSVYEILSEYAMKSQTLANGMIFLPYLSGSLQPYQEPELRGGFLNVGLHNDKNDFVRSILEGVGYMLKENLLALEIVLGKQTETVISMGGGSKSDIWCEVKAAINQVTIKVEEEEEITSIGAAFLCALGLKHYNTMEEIQKQKIRTMKEYRPLAEAVNLYQEGYQQYKIYLDFFVQSLQYKNT